MLPISFLDLEKEQVRYKTALELAFQTILRKTNYINGDEVRSFEKSLSEKFNTPFVLGCGNGTDAIYIALLALNLPKDAEIIVPSFTYAASAEPVLQAGLTPVFVDVDPRSYCIDISDLKSKITSKTKAIIVVHLFGQAVDLQSIPFIAKEHNLHLIEDNAQSLGSKVLVDDELKYTGTIGDIGTNSFFPSKNLGGFGDGGALFFRKEEHYQRAKMIASHGQSQKYIHDIVGINSRLDTLQAALLSVKLPYLDVVLQKRKENAQFYFEHLQHIDSIELPEVPHYSEHSFNQFTIRLKNNRRDVFQLYLNQKGIPSMVYYKIPLHHQKAFSGLKKVTLPRTEKLCEEVISIPVHPCLDQEQLYYIVDQISKFE